MKKVCVMMMVISVIVAALGIGYMYFQPKYNIFGRSFTSIRIERDTLTLGTLKYDEKRNASFFVENTGNEPLLIRDVQPSCGCTDVEWPTRPIRPGEKAEISIVFKPVSLGRFMKSIRVV